MARSLNRVTLIGNVGQAPEVRTVGNGSRVASFSLATGRTWTDAGGAKQEKTEWHRCIVWNNKTSSLADVVEKYVAKGDRIYVEGEIEYRQWQDAEGNTRYTTEIRVRELLMLGSKRDGAEAAGDVPAGSKAARPRAAKPSVSDDFSDFPSELDDESDDLPF